MSTQIPPEQCRNMQDIRQQIDAIDETIIAALGKRFQYVKAAAKFKKNQTDVRAPERFKLMLETRRRWAVEQGLSADVIEKLYRELVEYFISEELKGWSKLSRDEDQ